jgi:hypothetical protein
VLGQAWRSRLPTLRNEPPIFAMRKPEPTVESRPRAVIEVRQRFQRFPVVEFQLQLAMRDN